MAVYQFSALSNGQAISFSPNSDILNFDQSVISGANLDVATEGANIRITIVDAAASTGKSVVLLNTSPLQLATSNVTFANGSALLFGDNSPGTASGFAFSRQLGAYQYRYPKPHIGLAFGNLFASNGLDRNEQKGMKTR